MLPYLLDATDGNWEVNPSKCGLAVHILKRTVCGFRGMQVYLIFYGSWDCNNVTSCPSNPHTPQLIIDFIQGINGTSWMGTATSYYSKKGAALSNTVNWGGHTFVVKDDPDGCFLVLSAPYITNCTFHYCKCLTELSLSGRWGLITYHADLFLFLTLLPCLVLEQEALDFMA